MDNNDRHVLLSEGNVTPSIAYESITGLLESIREADDRIMDNGFELTKRALSELKLISKELKLISQNLRRLS